MNIISWNTTNACNLYCAHCYRGSGEESAGELSTAEGMRLIDEIAKAGFHIMIFSGGEPLLREDIFALIHHAQEVGLRPVLGTNGTLITRDVAERLKASGLMAAGISLDSLSSVAHDRLRGQQGAWQAAFNGMIHCRAAGLPFQIHTTVMDWNEAEITHITDFAVEVGARAHHIFFLVPTGRGEDIEDRALEQRACENVLMRIMNHAKNVPIEVKPTCAPQFIRVADQIGYKQRFAKGCLAGSSYCIISPRGDVQPCAYLDIPLGNVRTVSFERIWRENGILQQLRTASYSGSCGRCNYRTSCGGCRARAAYYHRGDYMSADPFCVFHREEARDV